MPITYKENMLMVLHHTEPDYIPMIEDFDQIFLQDIHFINEAPAIPGPPVQDWFGQYWTYEPTIKGSNPTPGRHLIDDITKWRDVMKFPDLDKLDWKTHAANDTAGWDRKHRLSRITIGFGMWERLFSTMDFMECLIALKEEPEACYDFFGAVADHKIRLYERVIHYYKPDQVVMHDDYGNSTSMFMSPDTWRELLKPHLARVIKSITDQDVFYEHHCCGYFAPIVEEIADLGASSFNTAHVSNKPAELKKCLGHKISFFGGFDNQFIDLPSTTEEMIRSHVRKTIDAMAPGGSWCPRCSNADEQKHVWINDEIIHYGSEHYYRHHRPNFQ